ncbi:hypothetical protein A3L11_07240 [Thermococcus siculi]|uniref:HEAT repeat domain-containing protein n=1 Tax=Thermococcus siculi TaxID=72803 RepID=A0A2Z2MKZ1_9EURY|nr:hypothetical protein [Thermococcus siculi]ASJ09032.1 hypothetical protein A3L11_07240 [Thermococcus siculi]
MGFLSFGSKKDKIKKLIEQERFDEAASLAIKDKKALSGLIELLDEASPGIRGDALLILGMVAEQRGDLLEAKMETIFPKTIKLAAEGNPYVRENAMVLSYELARRFHSAAVSMKDTVKGDLIKAIQTGDKNLKAFALLMAAELGISEARPYVEELTGVEDKVILPFEGKKWVPLGEIAREALEKLD